MVIVDETLSESQVQSIRVGPTNVSVRFIVQQDPPLYRNVGVGVSSSSTIQAKQLRLSTIKCMQYIYYIKVYLHAFKTHNYIYLSITIGSS